MDNTKAVNQQKFQDYQAMNAKKGSQRQQEKEWVSSIVEMQRVEDRVNKDKRSELQVDLAQTYAQQGHDRREAADLKLGI